MSDKYIATVYCNEEQIAVQKGDDVEKLYTWMLIQVDGNFGDVHGEIIEINTNKVVKKFRKSPIE